jgi:PAS domain S-box-containing protein
MKRGMNALRVLVIDDIPSRLISFQELLQQALEEHLFTGAHDEKILQDLATNSYDIIIVKSFLQQQPVTFISQLTECFSSSVILLIMPQLPAELEIKYSQHQIDHHSGEDLGTGTLKLLISYSIERKKNALLLAETRERYNLLTKATNNIVWDWELAKHRAYWVGSGIMNILGYDQQEMIVNTDFWEKNLHPEDKDRVTQKLQQIFQEANRNNWEDEYRFRHKDGSYSYIYDRGFILFRDNVPVRMIGSMEDVTQRKLAEAASVASQQNYKNLFDYNPLPIYIWDVENFSILEVNQAAMREYGYTEKEFLERNVFDLRPPDQVALFKNVVSKLIAEDSLAQEKTWIHRNKAGEQMLMQVSSYKVVYNGRQAVLALAKNVTERTALEKKLELEKSLRQQQVTEAVVTAQEKERTEIGKELHDNVNQLLSASRLYIEAAKNDEKDGKGLLTQASDYIMTAIEEIRTLSRALNSPLISEIGLKDVVQNLADDLMAVHGIRIDVNMSNFDELGLHENFKLTIFRIIQEQVTNILKHAHATVALIDISRDKDSIYLSIKDNGVGFDPGSRKKGIGLSNMNSRAALYNGKFLLESEKGKGSVLSLEFPVKEALDDSLKLIG